MRALKPTNTRVTSKSNSKETGGHQAPKRSREPENTISQVEIIDTRIHHDSRAPAPSHPQGPTSFAGLIPNTEFPPSEPFLRPTRRMRTFQDVAGAAAISLPAVEIVPLSQSDWLPPIMPPKPPLFAKDSAPAAHNVASAVLLAGPLPSPPMDWSLKRHVRFASSKPLLLCQEARSLSRTEVTTAERLFASNAFDTLGDLSPPQRLIMACMTWQFPNRPLPPDQERRSHSSPSFVQRRRDWQEALCSVYDAFCSGACAAFYVTAPQTVPGTQAARAPLVALFGAAGLGGRRRVHALLSRSTSGLRKVLRLQGVEFESPLMGPGPGGAEGTRGMLVFRGSLRVHALFDFFLNKGLSLADESCDVPPLIAPVSFAHAAPQRLALEGGESNVSHQTKFQVDLRGERVPPWVFDRVTRVLSDAQGPEGLTVSCDVVPETVGLNWHSPEEIHKGEDGHVQWSELTGPSHDETPRWRAATPGFDTVGIKEMTYANGTYKLTKTTGRISLIDA